MGDLLDPRRGPPRRRQARVARIRPALLIRVSGLAVFGAAIAVYADAGFSAIAFIVLFLVPDISFAASAAGPRIGAAAYNAVHTYAVPVALAAAGVLTETDTLTQVALIWLAHIGIDRSLGYGLKYPTGFKDSHLDRV
ncbi:MAG: DUF4260 domain-containing protein [Thermoleophilaceae bacterium]|nr:DUF4260 domain-containing protein [Thermoleophilaceae bacterium]